ncbi:cell division regulator GpsB [Enterococcus sp. MJM12]|uniref:Cell cycle protein GpsB n=1 Tax=Candidatus Enterococcus myersii TaxID=2815322 RepID=A0ABS3H561_9ENTE|nr:MULTISPECIES: cell division regulator GpsB [Enterococcus]MBO0448584.1 cell division regulator GpsB [Enterococcus sp. MJM12]MCD1025129.1 cell division regulator GpsB [Enterococcus sp. SMC-9]MDT2740497.1 cell division regulator GpsB [Enterococcus canintestini]WHA10483.1 cell division regulator GpsB [Enterococcus montenegrensis]
MANLNYSPKDILQQEFKTKMRGYDPVEVDEFLDNVIKDYEAYNKEILALQEENDRLQAKLSQQAANPTPAPSRVQTEAPKSQTVTNFDILKRLSNLEKEVFGKKLDQDTTADRSEVTTRVSQSLNGNYTNDENSDDNERTRRF